jgi:hypothetical protein
MIKEFGEALRRKLREDMNNYADDVASGSCPSFDAYQKTCGVISGLALAERHLLDLLEKVEKHNE